MAFGFAGIYTSKSLASFKQWADKQKSLHLEPCADHMDGKHRWEWRRGTLAGEHLSCKCGAVKSVYAKEK